MKVVITGFVVLIATIGAAAQSTLRFKVFHHTDFIEKSISDPYLNAITRERVWTFRRVSFAFEFGKHENFKHQLEVFFPQVERPTNVPAYPINYTYSTGPYNWESTAFSFRYEALKKVGGSSDRVRFVFGLGLNPYYQKLSMIPMQSNFTYHHTVNLGAVINAIAGTQVALTNRLGFEASLPLKIYDLRFKRQKINNPALPPEYQMANSHEHIFFETAYTLRVGLTYDLK